MKTTMFNIDKLIRPNIKVLKAYTSARDEYKELSENMCFLDANENPFENGVNRYPDPQQINLKLQIGKLKQQSVKNILLGNGSDEVLDLIFRSFCEPKQDNVITQPPTYGMYEVLANLNAVEVLQVPLTKDFQPKVEDVISKQNEFSKLLFLCSPNNPTANSFDSNKIEALINGFNGIVIIDEAYIDFSERESWLSRLGEFPNLIVTQTLSKAYGMAGIRLGMCFASSEIISVLNKIKPPYNINALTQEKALSQLLKEDLVKSQVDVLKAQRIVLKSALETIDFIENIHPSDANFLLIKVDDAPKRYQQLVDNGIVIRNRSAQLGCENCLRITVGTQKENEKLVEVLLLISNKKN